MFLILTNQRNSFSERPSFGGCFRHVTITWPLGTLIRFISRDWGSYSFNVYVWTAYSRTKKMCIVILDLMISHCINVHVSVLLNWLPCPVVVSPAVCCVACHVITMECVCHIWISLSSSHPLLLYMYCQLVATIITQPKTWMVIPLEHTYTLFLYALSSISVLVFQLLKSATNRCVSVLVPRRIYRLAFQNLALCPVVCT